ncbi:hypothetical protein Q7P37_011126 [Cladosporium fusiforme]
MPKPRQPQPIFKSLFPNTDSMDLSIDLPMQPHQPICNCRCDCTCCYALHQTTKNMNQHNTSPRPRGRSPTPKYDRTNGNGRHLTPNLYTPNSNSLQNSTPSSIQGEEGLAPHQYQYESQSQHQPQLTSNSLDTTPSIHNWLTQNPSTQTPSHSHDISFPATSPSASLLVEPSMTTTANSLASSGLLHVGKCEELLMFADGGFGEAESRAREWECAFTPLWLGHERRHCRGLRLVDASAAASGGGGVAGEGVMGSSVVLE